ncbi:MAG: transcription antitermination factor NusB [Terracidiphilus sp.]|jgi:16S rRNA (cytosine967-C5)-methyltransferase
MTDQKSVGARKIASKDRAARISAARKAAFDILLTIERGQSHSDDLLRGKGVNALSGSDCKLTTALVLGVLRWQIRLDHQIRRLLSRPNAKLDAEILIALRLGAFQILQMDRIPARAAIDESVELVKQAGHGFASRMVNAVLRKLDAAPPLQFSEECAAELALTQAHPTWMVERWISFYGLDAAQAICRHGQSQPALSARMTQQTADLDSRVEDRGLPPFSQKDAKRMGHPSIEEEVTEAGVVFEAGEVLTAARTVASGDVTATEAFREGRLRIQDEGSQLVAELAGGRRCNEARRILDACAAPGGKTLILAERNPHARIVACEASAPRLEQLRERLAFLGEHVECRLADAGASEEREAYDLVLADVPCSGTGTLGRNPEIRHRLRMEDLARQAERQRAILSAAIRAVRPGGLVVYSTCSLEPEENEEVVAAVLAAMPRIRSISLDVRIGELLADGVVTVGGAERLRGSLTAEGALRLLPGAFHSDGFYIALIERIA